MRFRDTSEAALYLWDYFYLSRCPTESERKSWRKIECATIRIRDSEQFMSDEYPPPVRLANAKRVRRAAREIGRLVEQLESVPESWVVEAVACFEALADVVIEALRDVARQHPLH